MQMLRTLETATVGRMDDVSPDEKILLASARSNEWRKLAVGSDDDARAIGNEGWHAGRPHEKKGAVLEMPAGSAWIRSCIDAAAGGRHQPFASVSPADDRHASRSRVRQTSLRRYGLHDGSYRTPHVHASVFMAKAHALVLSSTSVESLHVPREKKLTSIDTVSIRCASWSWPEAKTSARPSARDEARSSCAAPASCAGVRRFENDCGCVGTSAGKSRDVEESSSSTCATTRHAMGTPTVARVRLHAALFHRSTRQEPNLVDRILRLAR